MAPPVHDPPSDNGVPNRFEFNAISLGATWPRNLCSKEHCLENIKLLFGENLHWAVVCEESHVDGSPHLHAFCRFRTKIHRRGADCFDILTQCDLQDAKHGNYEPVRRPRQWLGYVIKDGNYVTHGDIDIPSLLRGKGSKYAAAVAMILDGKTLNEVFDVDAATWARYFNELCRIKSHYDSKQARSQTLSTGDLTTFSDTSQVCSWLEGNMFLAQRQRRTRQLYIVGKPGAGKSRLASLLMKLSKTFIYPDDEKFEDWSDDYDLVIYDEPQASKLQFINKFLSGEVIKLPGRYKQTVKTKNVPFVFLSNNSPAQLYKQASEPDSPSYPNYLAFIDRLKIVNTEDDHPLIPICEHLEKIYNLQ